MESDPSVPPSPARAQLLATEHWSLLAGRGSAQSEVLTRISIELTLVSAGLVTLGLLAQAMRFGGGFRAAEIGVLVFLVVVGLMTQTRVSNIANQDMEYVIGMNRLRAGYVELDPGIERYLITASHDDEAGMRRTYAPILADSPTHAFGSSFMLIFIVNGLLVGLLCASAVAAIGAPLALIVIAGAVAGLAFFVTSVMRGRRRYVQVWDTYRPIRPRNPSAL